MKSLQEDRHPAQANKEHENAAALEVLPDLLKYLDVTNSRAALTALIEGVSAVFQKHNLSGDTL